MDPVSALGVAAAAVAFIEFGVEALDLCRQVRDNVDGATDTNKALEKSIKDLKSIQKGLPPAGAASPTSSRKVHTAARECTKLADELLELLLSMKGASGKSSLRAVLRAVKERKTVEKLRNRLETKKAQLDTAISVDIRNRIDLNALEQSKQFQTLQTRTQQLVLNLQDLRHDAEKNTQDLSHQLDATSRQQIAVVASTSQSLSLQLRHHSDTSRQAISAVGANIGDQLVASAMADSRRRFLDSLAFPNMTQREETIRAPFEQTCQWAFEDWSDNKFLQWLRSDKSVFWISGKAGSGKSTLMSHIAGHKHTKEELAGWTGDSQLRVFRFYFWRPGNGLQKTIAGLFRSLLHQMLEIYPSVIDHVLVQLGLSRDEPIVWAHEKLREALQYTLAELLRAAKVAIFIDGLDEFEGDDNELLDVLLQFHSAGNIKLCLSSRPEVAMVDRLSSFEHIRLQDLNYPDICLFVEGKLCAYQDLLDMTREISNRTEGVFLWAVLVVRSMIEGHQEGEDREELQNRLRSTPTELDDLIRLMLDQVKEANREAVLLCMHAIESSEERDSHLDGLRLMGVHCGPRECVSIASATAALQDGEIVDNRTFTDACGRTERRIIAQSKGLLDVHRTCDLEKAVVVSLHDAGIWNLAEVGAADKGLARINCLDSTAPDQRQIIHNLFVYEKTSITWVHRSAYDLICGPNEAPPGWKWTVEKRNDFQLKIMRGQLKILESLPVASLRSDPAQSLLKRMDVSKVLMRLSQFIFEFAKIKAEVPEDMYCYLDRARYLLSNLDRVLRLDTTSEATDPPWASAETCSVMAQKEFWRFGSRREMSLYYVSRRESIQAEKLGYLSSILILREDRDLARHCFHPFDISHTILRIFLEDISALASGFSTSLSQSVRLSSVQPWWPGFNKSSHLGDSWSTQNIAGEDIAMLVLADIAEHFKETEVDSDNENAHRELHNLLWMTLDRWDVRASIQSAWNLHKTGSRLLVQIDIRSFVDHFDSVRTSTKDAHTASRDTWDRPVPRIRLVGLRWERQQRTSNSLLEALMNNSSIRPDEHFVVAHDVSPATALALYQHLSSRPYTRSHTLNRDALQTFDGSLEDYASCRQAVIDDIWANSEQCLSAWHQLYVLACVKKYFKYHWKCYSDVYTKAMGFDEEERRELVWQAQIARTERRAERRKSAA